MHKIVVQEMYHPVYVNNTTGEYSVKYYRPGETEDSNLTLVHPYTANEFELDTEEVDFSSKLDELFNEFISSGISYVIKNDKREEGYFTITVTLSNNKILDKSAYIKTIDNK